MIVFKIRKFAKWQMLENLSDTVLCEAVKEMQAGLIDACLGGLLYKKRVASLGSGNVEDIERCCPPASARIMFFSTVSQRTKNPISPPLSSERFNWRARQYST